MSAFSVLLQIAPMLQYSWRTSSMPIPELDRYISVDVETSGPNPSTYSLLSIGACTLAVPRQNFYVELKPASANAVPEALEVTGLRLEQLEEHESRPGRHAAVCGLGPPRFTRREISHLCGFQRPLRLDVRQRLFPALPGCEPVRAQRPGYPRLLHGSHRVAVERCIPERCHSPLPGEPCPLPPCTQGCPGPGRYISQAARGAGKSHERWRT